ncbi:Flagellar hook-basal body complex protein FliE [Nitrincola lacisaponensis]|uniref:Flagellar hook-basal body complex protein FliE n=1 Tax=Nitrincola lacisaponensis TaxID=267850 RepID=A0A063Y4A8_9GAMM|nr:flagellar hook-basal body complex protein FliE [Nitrincola lacisaponensis]KDE39606.1 Flagellar hook-basal body complex protein FliE [Nitrincola lacisaponensis]
MIERADINGVLAQMRSLRAEMQQSSGQIELPSLRPESGSIRSIGETERSSFTALLKSAVDQVNGHQQSANRLRESYERGDPGVDLPQVMIQAQKASVSFEAMTQVRNRLVQAYEDISKMPI